MASQLTWMSVGVTATEHSASSEGEQHTLSRLDRQIIFWVTLTVLSLPIILAAVRNLHALAHPTADAAIIQLYAEDIPERLPLIGVYSRFDFHHPGPLLYYLVTIPVHLVGGVGLALGAAAVSIASIGGLLFTMYRRGGQVLFILGVVLGAVLIRSMALDTLSYWNPNLLILPFALAIALGWAVWCGDEWALPWLAGVGTFVVQAHVGLAPPIGFLLVSSAIWTIRGLVRRRCSSRPALIAIGVFIVLWLPPTIEQFTTRPGNFSQIVSVTVSGSSEPTLGIGRALGLLGSLLGPFDPLTIANLSTDRLFGALRISSIAWMAVPTVALLVCAVIALRRQLHEERRLTAMLAGLVAMALVSLRSISGIPFIYLVRWVVVIAVFIWLDLVWTILRWRFVGVESCTPVRRGVGRGRRSLSVLAGGTAMLLAVGLIPLDETPGHIADRTGSAVVGAVTAPVRQAVDDCGLISVQPAIGMLEVSVASALVHELRSSGHDVAIDDMFAFSHGAERSLRGRTPDCTVKVSATTTSDPPGQDGDMTIATFDTLTAGEREEFRTLTEMEAAAPLSAADRLRLDRLRDRAQAYRMTFVRGPAA